MQSMSCGALRRKTCKKWSTATGIRRSSFSIVAFLTSIQGIRFSMKLQWSRFSLLVMIVMCILGSFQSSQAITDQLDDEYVARTRVVHHPAIGPGHVDHTDTRLGHLGQVHEECSVGQRDTTQGLYHFHWKRGTVLTACSVLATGLLPIPGDTALPVADHRKSASAVESDRLHRRDGTLGHSRVSTRGSIGRIFAESADSTVLRFVLSLGRHVRVSCSLY